jgi:hypothetical protein
MTGERDSAAVLDEICALLNEPGGNVGDAYARIGELIVATGRPILSAPVLITARVDDGDYGLPVAVVGGGGVTVTVYQSHDQAEGITVDIDTDDDVTMYDLSVTLNDGEIWERRPAP